MALIELTLDGQINKVDKAIQRIRTFEPISNGLFDTPYYVAYSGGKDSDAIRILCELAGVKYDLVHNHTTVDAPETVRYVRSIPGIDVNYPSTTMWKLIVDEGVPPTRLMRYCCKEFKEHGGENRFVVTGVRWYESNSRRTNRGGVEIQAKKKKDSLILNADNDESRRMFENCQMKGNKVINPIIDWADADVWEFLDYCGMKSNPLYQEGYKRIGCIGCPQAPREQREQQFCRWPKYRNNYIKAFERMLKAREAKGLETTWTDAEDVFNWWMNDKNIDITQVDGQTSLYDDFSASEEDSKGGE